jgi:hypothetical protein
MKEKQKVSKSDSSQSLSLGNQRLLHDRLQQLFKTGFTAIDIAEPLVLFDAHEAASEVKAVMESQCAHVAGVGRQGEVLGYVRREALKNGICRDHVQKIAPDGVLNQYASYQDVIEVLDLHELCFVSFLGQVAGIIQKKDMTKPSVRMWLFGLITISEMIISDMVERLFPNESWQEKLSEERLAKAQALREERQRKGQDLKLMDCLYLADKARILTKEPSIRQDMGFESRKEAKKAVSQLESLRNSLAHAHDIVTYDWKAIVEMSRRLDRMLSRL